jgi:hypothetical protein
MRTTIRARANTEWRRGWRVRLSVSRRRGAASGSRWLARSAVSALIATAFLWLTLGTARANVLVVSHGHDDLLVYDDSGNFVGTLWDGPGGAVNVPAILGIAIGPDGAVYVGRVIAAALRRFDPSINDLVPFITGGALANPHGITFGGPNDDLYVADLGNVAGIGGVERFDGTTGAHLATIAPTSNFSGVAVDAAGTVYMSSRSTGVVFKEAGGVLSIFATVSGNPEGLTLGPDGNLYVGTLDNRVLRFQPDGTPFGAGGNTSDPTLIQDGRLNGAFSVAFGSDGSMYVADHGNSSVLRFDPDTGAYLSDFISSGAGGLRSPSYMVFGIQIVPEPGTLLLLGGGLTALSAMAGRRKKQRIATEVNLADMRAGSENRPPPSAPAAGSASTSRSTAARRSASPTCRRARALVTRRSDREDEDSKWLVPLEAPPGFEPGIKDLQSHALPLGYGASERRRIANEVGGAGTA